MTKKQLHLIIVVLGLLLLYVLFMPTDVVQKDVEEAVDVATSAEEEAVVAEDVQKQASESEPFVEVADEPIVLNGVFIGLLDGEDPFQKKFKYMLLNDGEEVLRIDLRPLVGYSDINITEKLGVDRNDEVKVVGVMNDGDFVVESIE